MTELADLVRDLPDAPGVYLWKDESAQILYIGKAKSLRRRVSSYLRHTGLDRKTWELMQRARDLETIVTSSEREALLLEAVLIRRHQPKYNLALKDDRRHAWIRIDLTRTIPTVAVTRDVSNDGARYFGPYGSIRRVERLVETMRRLLPVALCGDPASAKRECIDFHTRRCVGPCKGHISVEDYRVLVTQLCQVLEGRGASLSETLREEMLRASESLDFERAAQLRDRLTDLAMLIRRQTIVEVNGHDRDVLGIARTEQSAIVQVLVVRNGVLIGTDHFFFSETLDRTDEEIITAFIEQFYFTLPQVPQEIIVPVEIAEMEQLAQWLSESQKSPVRIHTAETAAEREVVQMANANAIRSLKRLLVLGEEDGEIVDDGVKELRTVLGLQHAPLHIECFDVANVQGTDPTGSCVVFHNGQPDSRRYRMFRVRVKQTPDDYAMMREVVLRRYRGVLSRGEPLPDLILVDGGKGQLSSALTALRELGIDYVPLAALAKQEETIFTRDHSDGLTLSRDSSALRLLQRIRDEAHRFAQRYHHMLRERHFRGSILEEAPGIGPRRRAALLQAFGSVDGVRGATVEALSQVEGMNRSVAVELRKWLDEHATSPESTEDEKSPES